MKTFYSNGKLLITGEYVVLKGAKALALPTRYGQGMTVKPSEKKGVAWNSLDHEGRVWFEDHFDISPTGISASLNTPISKTLSTILLEAKKLNPSFLKDPIGWEVISKMDFPNDWGLGSSSTLINNIAQWAQVDPFQLLDRTMGGSGYDIAAAQSNGPFIYQLLGGKPTIEQVTLPWNFTEHLFFVHLNKKQDSRQAIASYLASKKTEDFIGEISAITESIVHATHLKEFEILLTAHEKLISQTMGIPTVQEQLFKDYEGTIKSLGAWGGDFVLVTGTSSSVAYFQEKGFSTICPFKHMIL